METPHEKQKFHHGPLPIPLLTLLLLSLFASLLLHRTVFGAHLYAVGGSAARARLAGIRTERIIVAVHVICSLLAGVTRRAPGLRRPLGRARRAL
jgi:ribose/xylose/arabinose/galactoside ABC-type transport system permease subunit